MNGYGVGLGVNTNGRNTSKGSGLVGWSGAAPAVWR